MVNIKGLYTTFDTVTPEICITAISFYKTSNYDKMCGCKRFTNTEMSGERFKSNTDSSFSTIIKTSCYVY